jgi:hypothetical protein
LANITQWASQGLHSIQVGQRGASGYFAGWAGLDATDTDSQSSTRLLVGGITAPSPLPQFQHVRNRGRNGFLADRIFESAPNDFTLTFEDFDAELSALMNSLTILTLGEWDIVPEGGPTTFQNMMWLFARHAISKESGSDGTEGFENLLVYSSSGRYEPGNMEYQAPGAFNIVATGSPVQKTIFGTTALVAHGQQSFYTERWFSTYPCFLTCFVADGSEVDIGLGYTPISTAKTKCWNFTTGLQVTVNSVNTSTDEAVIAAAQTSGDILVVVAESTDI